ncbi:host cell division inhibitory peptide Kil [Salmonella enterica subsp. enterica serovar Montevideo]|uniref:Host cell division inhibitory peptide Kil n=1 Tax=Salmonella montevideo TaxID=115981 RepID=A0A725HQL8_SALMO|nr:host cell division inhibitory peptide Kil [Salmonella enterica subsp. enterica serovar Montevideo]EBO9850923.1 host cell division inhibitory peptide Kil [Salmonella enterica]HCZ3100476.1 host cell division inhibitory peptide Kil [Salmonella enterica subsp. enterica serovar Anatum str. CFSAN004012]EBL5254497.1 host cell division inhibitory peptide Kil [Salmonella enterica subsp. enterica serovar Montevideo]EBL5763376.1 host cell division inhibitory peptide Kil [Salmonella enterica subsp. ente
MQITINHQKLIAAQSKAVIARFLGDARMWKQANEEMKSAINLPWYRKS